MLLLKEEILVLWVKVRASESWYTCFGGWRQIILLCGSWLVCTERESAYLSFVFLLNLWEEWGILFIWLISVNLLCEVLGSRFFLVTTQFYVKLLFFLCEPAKVELPQSKRLADSLCEPGGGGSVRSWFILNKPTSGKEQARSWANSRFQGLQA